MDISLWYFIYFIYFFLTIYVFIRGIQALPKIIYVRVIYTIVYFITTVSLNVAYFLSEKVNNDLIDVMKIIGGFWILYFTYFVTVTLIADFLRLLNHYLKIFPKWITKNFAKAKFMYLVSSLLFLLLFSLIGYYKYAVPRLVELNLKIDKENVQVEDISIIVVSDIHVGNIIRKERLSAWINLINEQNPDLILILGDIFDGNFDSSQSPDIIQELSRLNADLGIFAILGNHEYYIGVEKAIDYLNRSGITSLRDQSIVIDNSIILIGRDDIKNTNRVAIDSFIKGQDTNLPVILMDHRPIEFDEAVKNDIDLHLSGHLHNGQVFPYSYYLSKTWELSHGYKKINNTHFYVSSGLGLSFVPIRFGTHSEIIKIKFFDSN